MLRWLFGMGLGVLSLAGCSSLVGESGSLIVATTWPRAERARIEAEYLRKVESALATSRISGRIVWVVLDPSDDIRRLARRRRPPDVLLGGLLEAHLSLDGSVVSEVREATRLSSAESGAGPRSSRDHPWRAAIDPSRDPIALHRVRGSLNLGDWDQGYAKLVSRARGSTSESEEEGPELREGVSMLKAAENPEAAVALLSLFERRTRLDSIEPDDGGLLADLLGATLVESRQELRLAWETLEKAGHPPLAERWMTEPPPWPPASVAKMLQRESNAMAMVETLAGQVAPEADSRAWLVRSWLSPPRNVNGTFLQELNAAVDGRLALEPRFRSWLRSEWTAWARQRYRRVARNAEAPRS